jgi:hypothetical protein
MPAARRTAGHFNRNSGPAHLDGSDLPIKRIKEAVSEIKKATGKDKVLGAAPELGAAALV